MADGRNASWYQVDNDCQSLWVVTFEGPEGVYLDTYRTSDFDDVQAVVDAWIQDGRLPDDQVEECDTYDEYRDSYLFNDYE